MYYIHIFIFNPQYVQLTISMIRVLCYFICFLYYNSGFFFLVEQNLEGHFIFDQINMNSNNDWTNYFLNNHPNNSTGSGNPHPGGGPSTDSVVIATGAGNSNNNNFTTNNPQGGGPSVATGATGSDNLNNHNPSTLNLLEREDIYRLQLAERLEDIYERDCTWPAGKRYPLTKPLLGLDDSDRELIKTHYSLYHRDSIYAEKILSNRFRKVYLTRRFIRELRTYGLN